MSGKYFRKLIIIYAAIASLTTFCLGMPQVALAIDNPVPNEIKNLTMGANPDTVKEMIKGGGEVTAGEPEAKRGPRIIWTPTASPYYQTIEFSFTEKDRLYIIRYHVKEGPREEYQGLKKAFFELYKFRWEDPMRMKIRENDALVYDIEDNNVTYYFEITDRKTGNKCIEIFDRRISAQDKAARKAEEASKESAGKAAPEADKGNEPAPK